MRYRYLDSLKAIACFIIYTTHFIAHFNYAYFDYWHTFPYRLILDGISGKFGVCIFAVILGYLAYEQGTRQNKTITNYGIKRYLYFMICGLIINTLYRMFHMYEILGVQAWNIKEVISCSFQLKDYIFPTFWCIRDFLCASIIAYIMGYFNANCKTLVLVIALLMFRGETWVAICLLGGVAYILIKRIVLNKMQAIILAVLIFIFIKRPENTITYYIDGIIAASLIVLTCNVKMLNVALNNKFMSYIGKNSMTIFLIHPIVYTKLGKIIMDNTACWNYRNRFVLTYIICGVSIIGLSVAMTYCINYLYKWLGKYLDRIGIYMNDIIERKTETRSSILTQK